MGGGSSWEEEKWGLGGVHSVFTSIGEVLFHGMGYRYMNIYFIITFWGSKRFHYKCKTQRIFRGAYLYLVSPVKRAVWL